MYELCVEKEKKEVCIPRRSIGFVHYIDDTFKESKYIYTLANRCTLEIGMADGLMR